MESFKEFERKAWEEKADRYDDTWGKVSSQSFDTIIELADIKPGISFLDCGCGAGHLCFKASQAGATVIGADYSHKMVELAKKNYPEIDFQHQDAENLTFEDDSFNVVTLNYILLHVANQQGTLLEAKRVLTDDGKLIFSNWLPTEESPGLNLMFSAIKEYADMSVIPPAEDVFLFSDIDYATEFLKKNNFTDISFRKINNFWTANSVDEFFVTVQAGTRMGGTIHHQTPEVKQLIKEHIAANIEKFSADGRYIIPTPSIVFSAKKIA